MRRLLPVALLAATVTACGELVLPEVPPPAFAFAPADALFNGRLSEAPRFAPYLEAAKEGPLCPAPCTAERYRFTWLRSFHAPVIVRIDNLADGRRFVLGKVLSGQGGYAPGEVTEQKVGVVTNVQLSRLRRLLDEAGFWADDGWRPVTCCDGAEWILEGAKPGAYHVVARWSAYRRHPAFAEACLYMLEIADLTIDSHIY